MEYTMRREWSETTQGKKPLTDDVFLLWTGVCMIPIIGVFVWGFFLFPRAMKARKIILEKK